MATKKVTDLSEIVNPASTDLVMVVVDPVGSATSMKCEIGNLPGGGGGAISNHDHSGDEGDGGTFDAANLTSGAAADGQVLTADGAGGAAWEGPTALVRQTILTVNGDLEVGNNPLRIYNRLGTTQTVSEVFLSVATAPTGQAIIVDVHKDGVTIFTNQAHRPQIATTQYTGSTTNIDVGSWAHGAYLTAHIDQVGSIVAGADLVVHIIHS